jgi:hypothetical protein
MTTNNVSRWKGVKSGDKIWDRDKECHFTVVRVQDQKILCKPTFHQTLQGVVSQSFTEEWIQDHPGYDICFQNAVCPHGKTVMMATSIPKTLFEEMCDWLKQIEKAASMDDLFLTCFKLKDQCNFDFKSNSVAVDSLIQAIEKHSTGFNFIKLFLILGNNFPRSSCQVWKNFQYASFFEDLVFVGDSPNRYGSFVVLAEAFHQQPLEWKNHCVPTFKEPECISRLLLALTFISLVQHNRTLNDTIQFPEVAMKSSISFKQQLICSKLANMVNGKLLIDRVEENLDAKSLTKK